MWLLIHTILLPPPPPGFFLLYQPSNRFHVQHSCPDWSQNMRPSRRGRNRLMIYTFYSTRVGDRSQAQDTDLATGCRRLFALCVAIRPHSYHSRGSSGLYTAWSLQVVLLHRLIIHSWSASVDSHTKYSNLDVRNCYLSRPHILNLLTYSMGHKSFFRI